MLSGEEIRRLGIVDVAASLAQHALFQPNGVDLSLEALWRFGAAGALGQANADRRLPERQDLAFDADGWVSLEPGAYVLRYAESVDLPADCGGLCFPRSSLLRMGLHVPTAVWDAGYGGRGEGLLIVANPRGVRLQRGARIAQLVLFKLTQAAAAPYQGQYQNENRSVS